MCEWKIKVIATLKLPDILQVHLLFKNPKPIFALQPVPLQY